jgi:hypothetical protein
MQIRPFDDQLDAEAVGISRVTIANWPPYDQDWTGATLREAHAVPELARWGNPLGSDLSKSS